MNEIFFDLETQDGFGQDRDFKGLRMSVGVIFKNKTQEYSSFMEDEVNSLIDELFSSSLVIGFNLLSFDYKVLKQYTQKDLFLLPTLDILREAQKTLGFRISLDNLAKANLKKEKKGSGLDAVKWWKNGDFQRLIEYCRYDVEITKEIYELGKKQGFLYFTERGGGIRQFDVKW